MTQNAALVTGASRGIGQAVAIAPARKGVDIGIHYHVPKSAAEETCSIIPKIGRHTVTNQADVSKTADIERMVETVFQNLGTVRFSLTTRALSNVISWKICRIKTGKGLWMK